MKNNTFTIVFLVVVLLGIGAMMHISSAKTVVDDTTALETSVEEMRLEAEEDLGKAIDERFRSKVESGELTPEMIDGLTMAEIIDIVMAD